MRGKGRNNKGAPKSSSTGNAVPNRVGPQGYSPRATRRVNEWNLKQTFPTIGQKASLFAEVQGSTEYMLGLINCI